MNDIIIFLILSLPIIYFSRKPLLNFKSHGFYRFFGWEGLAWLIANNYKYWFFDSFGIHQIFSWLLLFISLIFVVLGYLQMRKLGKASNHRDGNELYGFEKTTELVDNGIFGLVRHPLYGSLVYLTWGTMLKNPSIELIVVALISTVFYCLTMRVEEHENIVYFGNKYTEYMKKTKMFIPYIL